MIAEALTGAVWIGDYIPAHDRTFDLAQEIGERLDAFRVYVAEVRDAEHSLDALEELGRAIAAAIAEAVAVVPDTVSSASRQHYVDTGEYLPAGEPT